MKELIASRHRAAWSERTWGVRNGVINVIGYNIGGIDCNILGGQSVTCNYINKLYTALNYRKVGFYYKAKCNLITKILQYKLT